MVIHPFFTNLEDEIIFKGGRICNALNHALGNIGKLLPKENKQE
jgi:hypothetical protein